MVDELYRMTHLWLHDIETSETRRLSEGDFSVANPDWSPDSRQIAFETRPNPTANDRWRSDVRVVDVGDRGATAPARERRQRHLAALVARRPDHRVRLERRLVEQHPARQAVHSSLPTGGRHGCFLEDVDRDFSVPIWSTNGRYVFWPTGEGTSTGLFRVSIESGAVIAASAPGRRNGSWTLSDDGTRWAWVHTSPDGPAEIYTATADGGEPVRLTDANAWLRDEGVQLGTVETVRWTNGDGEPVEGVLTRPVDYEEGVAYPFIVNPHGGPTGASLAAFNATAQFFAGNGYVVLQPNFRGSTNYGRTSSAPTSTTGALPTTTTS